MSMSGYNPNPFRTLHILADNLRTLPTTGDPEPFFRGNQHFFTTSSPFIQTTLLAFHCALFLFSRPPRPLQSITKAAKLGHTFCRHFSILNSVSNNATDFALALLDRQPLKIWFLFKLVLKLFSSQSGPRLALQQNINITSPGHASGQHL